MNTSFRYFLLLVLTAVFTVSAFADVKIKSRQTMSGQTNENTTYIKGKRQRTEQNVGSTQMITLTQCDLKRGIQLNPQAQVYIVNSWADDASVPTTTTVAGNTKTEVKKGGVVTTTITTKDTGETKKMFGFTAHHLIITTETEASADACTPMKKTKMVTDGWYIDAAFQLDCDYQMRNGYGSNNYGGGCRDKYDVKQIGTAKRGYPVLEKMTMYDETGKETFSMTNEVIELSNTTLDAALFDVPQGWREVKDQQSLYTASSSSSSNSPSVAGYSTTGASTPVDNSGLSSTISSKNAQSSVGPTNAVAPKKDGTIRIGLAGVKTGAVGEGINAAELAGAIQNTLQQYLKGTKVEIVPLEAKLQSAVDAEAQEKQCDYVLNATVSHKKGGGGFGMFGKIAPVLGTVVPMAGMGSTAGQVAGQVATQAIYSAASASSSIKPKDELTLDIVLKNGANAALTKQFKAKAKSAGEDIISPLVEQAAQAIVDTVGK
ncbi:MAG: hypothetical protein JSS81_27125 [Acidobacteria bacterium]|nr:hypothetical protein [Acidobacteriota bacterium]